MTKTRRRVPRNIGLLASHLDRDRLRQPMPSSVASFVPMQAHTSKERVSSSLATAVRPRPIGRTVLLLAMATGALLLFIIWQSDGRRRNIAMNQAQAYALRVSDRIGSSGLLPLNLDPGSFSADTSGTYRMESLLRSQARLLRDADGPVLAAQTLPVYQVLGASGRCVVVFENKRFSSRWVTTSEFDHLAALTADQLGKLTRRFETEPPDGP